MGLASWFNDFCSDIQVKDGGTIASRYKAITRRLNTDFWDTTSETSHSLYVGSYGRNTAVKGFSDLDMVFELPSDLYYKYNEYSGNGQSALLQAIRTSLQRTYNSSSIGADGQVVCIHFDDGITFEIVPVFTNKAGSYTFPDSNNGGSWRTTNPRSEIEAIRDKNKVCNLNLVLLCRMMRVWKKRWDVPIGGLLIDTLAYQFIGNWEYKDKSFIYYDYICRDFFGFLASQNPEKTYWKAPGSDQHVYKKGVFQAKALKCQKLAQEAINFELATPKLEDSAKQKWREIFGTAFKD